MSQVSLKQPNGDSKHYMIAEQDNFHNLYGKPQPKKPSIANKADVYYVK